MKNNFLIKHSTKISFFSSIAGVVVIFDQFLKYKIRHSGGFYLCNSGISFGIPFFNTIFWLIVAFFSLTALFYCIFLYKKRTLLHIYPLTLIGLALFVGGGISNLIDRLFLGCVLDYIQFFKPFPVFNFADISIFLGSCFVLFFLLSKHEPCG